MVCASSRDEVTFCARCTQMVGANRRRLSGQLPASRYQDTSHIAHSGYDYGKEPDITQDGTGNDPLDLLKHLRSVDDPPLDMRVCCQGNAFAAGCWMLLVSFLDGDVDDASVGMPASHCFEPVSVSY